MASDMHFGAPDQESSLKREKQFVKWLNMIGPKASDLFLMGDVFDFWFEYKFTVPKGYIRLLGKLAELADNGVKIHIFIGNHDLWYRDYFVRQFNATIYRKPIRRTFFGKQFYLAHGDGLGPGDHGYKFLKAILTNPVCKWLFARLHPNFGAGIANYFSKKSRQYNAAHLPPYSMDKDSLYYHSLDLTKDEPEIQYFVYGHRHVAIQEEIAQGKEMINLGDWIRFFTYLEIGPDEVKLKTFPVEKSK